MSDILIKGMEMPVEQPVTLILDPSGRVWLPDIKSSKEYMASELPPHGDLVEADRLREIAYARGKEYGCIAFVDPVDIALAPVIVPAEKGETQ